MKVSFKYYILAASIVLGMTSCDDYLDKMPDNRTDVKGKNVVVSGAGTIGNLIAQFCIARGAKNVLITDVPTIASADSAKIAIDSMLTAQDSSRQRNPAVILWFNASHHHPFLLFAKGHKKGALYAPPL